MLRNPVIPTIGKAYKYVAVVLLMALSTILQQRIFYIVAPTWAVHINGMRL